MRGDELGEPDEETAAGRRWWKEGSEFEIACDVVIMALGTSPNPLLAATTEGLETNRRGCITADEHGATNPQVVACRRRRRDGRRDGDSG